MFKTIIEQGPNYVTYEKAYNYWCLEALCMFDDERKIKKKISSNI